MSALDDILNLAINLKSKREHDEARSELAALRKRVAELEAALDIGQINCDAVYDDLRSERDEDRAERDALLAELAESRTLRPSKCRPECWRKGWDAAIEAAAFECEAQSRRYTNLSEIAALECAQAVRALVPPADCGGACNPLTPDKLVDDLADALNDLRDKMGAEAWNKFVEMSHK